MKQEIVDKCITKVSNDTLSFYPALSKIQNSNANQGLLPV